MKVILLKDVGGLGTRFEIKDVADGYGLNHLIPKGLAEAATPAAIERIKLLQAREAAEKKIQADLLLKNIDSLAGKTVEVVAKANEKGHLFAGIHSAEIVKEIKNQTRLDIAPEFVVCDRPIKEVGEHAVKVKVGEKSVEINLSVKAATPSI